MKPSARHWRRKVKAELIDIPIKELKRDGHNPNVISSEQLEALKENIKKYGFLVPIIIDKDNIIADGEHRALIYQELGHETIPAYKLDVSITDRKILRQVLNKLRGTHDPRKDREEIERILQGLEDSSELINLLPDEGISSLLNQIENEGLSDDLNTQEMYDSIETPTTQRGDIWALGKHRLMCGDSTLKEDTNKLIDGAKVDMLFTDPPYGMGGYAGRSGKFEPMKGDDEDVSKFYEAMQNIQERYLWANWEVLRKIKENPRDVIIWKKNNLSMGKGYRGQYEICLYFGTFKGSDTDVWEIDKDTKYEHPTQKPVALALRAFKNTPAKTVLDLYGGSGSTLMACEQTNRKCYMMEIDQKYCDVIIKRWENYTNKKAILQKN